VSRPAQGVPARPSTSAPMMRSLEVDYDYEAVAEVLSREKIEARARHVALRRACCRSTASRPSGLQVGGTRGEGRPAREALGVEKSGSRMTRHFRPVFKDRSSPWPCRRPRSFGLTPSAGLDRHLANSVAANPPPPGWKPTFSSRPTWNGRKSWRTTSTGRRSWRSTAL